MAQLGFWNQQERHQKLVVKKPLLTQLNMMINWEIFRPKLSKIYEKENKSNAGRKPLDVILIFKMLILQQLYNLSDEELEYQVNDRLSFMNFLGLGIESPVPDATTVWLFRQKLTDAGLTQELFEEFQEWLCEAGYSAKGGQIVDATLIPVPKQRNSRKENEKIKNGETPEEWKEKPQKLAQKDLDARWTKKNDQNYYGYKNHISIDNEHKFVRKYTVTDASVHDSKVLGELLDDENNSPEIWGDSAYKSENIEWTLSALNFESNIHQRAYKNKKLTPEEIEQNREKSQVRARVEHVFGDWIVSMGGKMVRYIGLDRATTSLALKNLTYNLKRYISLQTLAYV
jgi:transposase, IS5 family